MSKPLTTPLFKIGDKVQYIWEIDNTLFTGEIVEIGTDYVELDSNKEFRTDDDRLIMSDIRIEKMFHSYPQGYYRFKDEFLYLEGTVLKVFRNFYYVRHEFANASIKGIFKHGYAEENKLTLMKEG